MDPKAIGGSQGRSHRRPSIIYVWHSIAGDRASIPLGDIEQAASGLDSEIEESQNCRPAELGTG